MRLQVLNQSTAPHKGIYNVKKMFRIRFCKRGIIWLSKNLADLIDAGKGVVILRDEQYPTDFYVASSGSESAYAVTRDGRGLAKFESDTLADMVSEAVGLELPFAVDVAPKPVVESGMKMYPLKVLAARKLNYIKK